MNNQVDVAKSAKKYKRQRTEANGLCLYTSLNLQLRPIHEDHDLWVNGTGDEW